MKNLLLMLATLLSCTTDYRLYSNKKDLLDIEDIEIETTLPIGESEETADSSEEIHVNEPDIEIDFVPAGGMNVKPGCSESGSFIVKNVGSADLIINDLDSYASVPADIQITSNYAPLPITIIPGDSHSISFDINQSDSIEDEVIIIAKSNDPDEPVAYSDATYTSDMGLLRTEEFEIKENRSADILMVVDNSCSMSEEQSELSSNAELFIDSLNASAIDYRIAVITTDSPSFVGPIITPAASDPALELSTQVNVGTYGSPYETGIQMASDALSSTGMASPGGAFLRADARLSIVWISDEDDFSSGTAYIWSSDFWSKKASPGDVSVWAIIGDPIYGCMTAYPGNTYNDLMIAMGGGWSSICSTDWGSPMAAVASGAGIDSTLELSGNPIMTSIRVFVGGVESFDWVYVVSLNAVSFNPGHIPVVGSHVRVEYYSYENCN